jgi:homoserine kinase
VRVPASSANLGPGFDALAVALDVFLECRFRRAERWSIRVSGRDAELISTGDDNLIRQIVGEPFDLEIRNAIPVGKGLGSSAAAVTAGVVIRAEGWDRARVLDEVARIEGHPDNASACVLGGIVASAMDSCGSVRAVKMGLPEKFGVAVIVPDFVVSTAEARAVLPETYSRADAIFNVQRAALLMAALGAGDADAMRVALEDRLHHQYRYGLVPGLEEMAALRAPGLLGCVLSGAGPSVLVFYERGSENVCQMVRGIFETRGRRAEILWTQVAQRGYELLATNAHE